MMYRGDTHGYIIAVLCAKSYKRDEYANGKNNPYLQRPPRGCRSASRRSDEPEKPAHRAAQCEQCQDGGHPRAHVGGRGSGVFRYSQGYALHETVGRDNPCHQARKTLLPLP